MTISSGFGQYAIVKNVLIIMFIPYNPVIIYKYRVFKSENRKIEAYQRWDNKEEIFFNQNKKLIARNDRKNIARRVLKVWHSTLFYGKFSLLVHIGKRIFQTTRRAMYMMENENNRIKIWKF